MTAARKSFRLDSEPVLRWPKSPAKLISLKEHRLEYSRSRMEYTIHPDKTQSVELVGWDYTKPFVAWRDVFSESSLKPNGLVALTQLSITPTWTKMSEWVSQNGLLGFRPSPNSTPFIPVTSEGGILIYFFEPVNCIISAAEQAANVLALWSALRKSYALGEGIKSMEAIRSVVTIKEDVQDSSKVGSGPHHYRTLVNGEDRNRWPIPETPRGWRRLATLLLSEYIQEHIFEEIEVAVGLRGQNRDGGERNIEPSPDWNLKPTWRIRSALAAYYVELLMVMRRFRSCEVCGEDISHQRATSVYCMNSSTCRTTDWHRKKAAEKKASKTPPGRGASRIPR